MTSVFEQYESRYYPFQYAGTIRVATLAGGTPSDPRVAEGWLKTKLADKDDLIRQAVAQIMAERGIGAEDAAKEIDSLKHLNGFKRNGHGLYIEGRQLKACLKEAASVATNAGHLPAKGWGKPSDKNYEKGIKAWFPEHVFVKEDQLLLGVDEPTGIAQRFVHAKGRSGIQYEEYVEGASFDFTVETDYEFPEEQWAALWLTAERQGIGASRSLGFGRFELVRWERR